MSSARAAWAIDMEAFFTWLAAFSTEEVKATLSRSPAMAPASCGVSTMSLKMVSREDPAKKEEMMRSSSSIDEKGLAFFATSLLAFLYISKAFLCLLFFISRKARVDLHSSLGGTGKKAVSGLTLNGLFSLPLLPARIPDRC